jgi:UDP-3-O-[3-hydroxymyristoyl] glucosamine N-acyltransferase
VLLIDDLEASLAATAHCIVGIGTPRYIDLARQAVMAKGVSRWFTVVNPSAYLAPGVKLGGGIYVAAHATVAIAASLGDCCVINQNVSVGHDVVIGRHCVVSPGCILSGKVELGDGVFLGSGAILLPGVKVGAESWISANCVVSQDVPAGVKVMPVTRNMELPREKATPSS